MTDAVIDRESLKGNTALAVLPLAEQRSVQPEIEIDPLVVELDPSDTTSALQGAQAILSRASRSAGRMGVNDDPLAAYQRAMDAKGLQDAREMANLAAWNTRKTILCGVEMTNEEAQNARQRVIDDDERYAQWAVNRGFIGEDQKDEFKRGARRKKELEDKRGRGTITDDEDREARAFDRSRTGQALDAATAQSHVTYGQKRDAAAQLSETNTLLRQDTPRTAPADDALFQSPMPVAPVPVNAATPVAPRVKAMGMDL